MKLRPLILDDASRAEICRVTSFAQQHPVPASHIQDSANRKVLPIGDNPNYGCIIPLGYRCVFSIEEHPKQGTMRHLSISVVGEGYAPNPACVNELVREFGFTRPLPELIEMGAVWEERIGPKKAAINVIEKV